MKKTQRKMDRYLIRFDSYDTYLLKSKIKNRSLSFTKRVLSLFSEVEI